MEDLFSLSPAALTYSDIVDEQTDLQPLKSFKYSGKDDSILYEKFMSPFCEYLVENHVPHRLAPNAITLIGLICVIIPHVVLMSSYEAEGIVPHRICYLMSAVGTLLYTILDNVDGKQARKRNQASPLGMIFDHGCDAFNTFLNGMVISRLFNISLNQQAVAVIAVSGLFYFATLEQYFTHYFYLPRINNVNEGVMLLVTVCLLGFLFGGGITEAHLPLIGLSVSDFVFHLLTLGGVAIMLNHYKTIVSKGTRLQTALIKALPIYCLTLALYLGVRTYHSRIDLYIFGFIFTKTTITLQVSHVLNKEFRPLRIDTMVVAVVWFISLVPPLRFLSQLALVLSVADCAVFAVVVSFRMARMLKINLLTYTEK